MSPESRILDVKSAIENSAGILPREQRLCLGTLSVEDADVLSNLGMARPLTFSLFRRSPEEGVWIERIAGSPKKFSKAPESIRACKEIVLLACKLGGEKHVGPLHPLEFVSAELRADREVAMTSVRSRGGSLQFLGDFCGDLEIVSAAVEQEGCALEFASDSLRANRDIVLRAVQQDGSALFYAAKELQMDVEIARLAVVTCSTVLEVAPEALKADRQLILDSIAQGGSNFLEFASDDIRADAEVVLAATSNSGECIEFASQELRSDRDFILKVVSTGNGGYALDGSALPPTWFEDRQVVLAAVSSAPHVVQFFPDNLRADREVMLAAMRSDGSVLHFASTELQSDPELEQLRTGPRLIYNPALVP